MIMNYITRKMKHETAERMVSTVGGQVLKLNEDVWFEDGRKAGREEGIKEGKVEGIKEGKEQGIKEGESNMKDAAIRIFIQDKQEDGITDNIIKEKLMRFFDLTEKEADSYLGMDVNVMMYP